jgi:hypothetical protein
VQEENQMNKSTQLSEQAKGKSVKSTDERKPRVLAALKAASGASKVTSVVQMKDGSYAGHCMQSIPVDSARSVGGLSPSIPSSYQSPCFAPHPLMGRGLRRQETTIMNTTTPATETKTSFVIEVERRIEAFAIYQRTQTESRDAYMGALRHFTEQMAKGLYCADAIAKYARGAQTAMANLERARIASSAPWNWKLDGTPECAGTLVVLDK